MDKKDGGTIDLEALLDDYADAIKDIESEAVRSNFTKRQGMFRTAREARAKVAAHVATLAQIYGENTMTNNKLADALRWFIAREADILSKYNRDNFLCPPSSDPGAMVIAFDAAKKALAEHDTPDECFCDRMYPDSNPNASCGDCPTRDYAPTPAPAHVQVDVLGELADEIEEAYPNADASNLRAFAAAHPPSPAADGAGELPPLPQATCLGFRNPCGITQLPDMGIYGYTSDQMHAYARAAIAAQQESRND